ncbi:hypothetical protein UA32_12645 [Photobacterium angustum]|uniref:Uncharacterized protein n=1 Tax=Photobacterium angustum TaxID=661 RepID=A0ABX5H260_PHOAN|nr:hypothetical protein [Photobacterium angustum]KJG37793.1 hypothetical protein UA32_12645 [Photobacterium angustum]PSX07063.1 hypothetical protein C0W27_15960 [Photobacterium angustum]
MLNEKSINSEDIAEHQNLENSVAEVSGSTGSTGPIKHSKRRKPKEKTIFNSQALLTRQLKQANSSEIKHVIDILSSAYTDRLNEEQEAEKQQRYYEEQAKILMDKAKELGLPLHVLKKAMNE